MDFDASNSVPDSMPVPAGSAGPAASDRPSAPRRYRYSEGSGSSSAANAKVLAVVAPGGTMSVVPAVPPIEWNPIWMALVGAGICFVIFYFAGLQQLVERWTSDAGWSHGMVVPLISVFFIRLKWET